MRKNEDRRVQKTRRILQNAIVELVVEKGFESIKVQDILDKANVGRSTFYAHYQDKGELLHSCFEELHNILEQHIAGMSEGSSGFPDLNFNSDFTLKLLKFAERNGRLFKALLKQQELSDYFIYSFIGYWNKPVKKMLSGTKSSPIPAEIISHYFIYAFIGILKWWISKDMPCSAEELDRYFKQLAMPSIKNI